MIEEEIPPTGGGLPEPKEQRKFSRLPGMTRRQTYKFIAAIPIIQVFTCFAMMFITYFEWYKVPFSVMSTVAGFSFLTSLSQWYLSKLAGYCNGHSFAVYTLFALVLLNLGFMIMEITCSGCENMAFDYYVLYSMAVSFSGLILSVSKFR